MTRPALGLDLDPGRTPSAPRPAATVLVVRPGERGVEVFCIERHPKSSFMGGVVAFPGGKLDPADEAEAWAELANEPPGAFPACELPPPASPRTIAVAACRETLEEAALLPVEGGRLAHDDALSLRAELGPGVALGDVLRRRGLRLDLSALRPFARWVTPEAEPRRFDAFFFLLRAPEGQEGASDLGETTRGFWATPGEIIARFAGGELTLAPPTLRCLELLSGAASIDDAFAVAARQSLLPVCPRFVAGEGEPPTLVLPGDPAHPVAERRVEGPSRFVLRDGRFVSEEAPG
jgi:8-oxo-dGTP pyrophosphatase MutT (NUDIX family)